MSLPRVSRRPGILDCVQADRPVRALCLHGVANAVFCDDKVASIVPGVRCQVSFVAELAGQVAKVSARTSARPFGRLQRSLDSAKSLRRRKCTTSPTRAMPPKATQSGQVWSRPALKRHLREGLVDEPAVIGQGGTCGGGKQQTIHLF